MKYTAFIAAGLAAGVSADDWQSWSSSKLPVTTVVCPEKVTKTITVTAACAEITSETYQKTITVEPPKTRTVTIYADGKTAKNFWEDWVYTPQPTGPTVVPSGCIPKTVTETEMVWITKTGSTTTITKSTLFVGLGSGPATTITVTAPGSAPAPAWQTGSYNIGAPVDGNTGGGSGGNDKVGSGSGGSGVGNYNTDDNAPDWTDANNGPAPEYYTAIGGVKIPVGEEVIGTDLWKWDGPHATNTKSYDAPEYTQRPDGTYGYDWGNWDDTNVRGGKDGDGKGPGKDDNGGSGDDNGSSTFGPSGTSIGRTATLDAITSDAASTTLRSTISNTNSSTTSNTIINTVSSTDSGTISATTGIVSTTSSIVTSTTSSITSPGTIQPGDPASNVTKPIIPLQDASGCNTAGSRGTWCDGKSAQSNSYENYFSGKTCTADFTLSRVTLNLDGSNKEYIAVNGQVPGPLLECNWGDMIQVTVHNQLTNNGTSFHWHGFRQVGTNNMDGVPGVTECPIAPGGSKTYTFHASSYGTTWYHSHWISQYGDGAYGPIIIHGPATADYDADMGVVAITDTFNVTAAQQNDIISHRGPKNTANYLLNGHNVKYDLSSGQHTLWQVESGKKYLFRFLNAAAQNMFSVSLDNHKLKVIAADFVPVVPYETEWLNIGIGQRYDVVVEMNQAVDSYFLRAVTQTQCPSGCDNTGLGNANGIVAYKGVADSPYLLPTSTTTKTVDDFNICDDEPLASLVPYVRLGAGTSSAFSASASKIPAGVPAAIQTTDDGVVFKWFLNNGAININFTQPTLQSLSQNVTLNSTLISNPIVLDGQQRWVYFVIQNQFFAAHPIHLHGHDFSILGQGFGDFDVASQLGILNFDNPMRRDTAMLKGAKPGPYSSTGYTVIGFETDNPGAWLMHCHIIWHVDGGLALQWIERPSDITTSKYVDGGFNQQCSAYVNYETAHPEGKKFSGSAGLKRRTYFDEQVARFGSAQFNDVVRRSDSMKQFIGNKLKRGFGDGYHARHFNRA